MYPAEGLVNGFYSFEDLPDTMNDGSLVKLSEPEIVNTEGGPLLAYYFDNYTGPFGGYGNIGYLGFFQLIPEVGWGTCVDFACGIVGNCLGGDSGLGMYPDDFADTYTVNTYDDFVGGSPASTFTITRQDVCLWSGFDSRYSGGNIVELRYNTPNENTSRASMWTMNINGRADGGPYNSPEGIYLDGNYVWEVVP